MFLRNTTATGTITEKHKGFPDTMKGGKALAKTKERGVMRWERDDECLALQWKGNRVVTLLTTIDHANDTVTVTRKYKDKDNNWKADENVKQSKAIERYKKFMNGVDRSDGWKTLFFHMIDIAIVNGHILFQSHRACDPTVKELERPKKYSRLEFREERGCQAAG